jgi:uncharacterized protein DUF6599
MLRADVVSKRGENKSAADERIFIKDGFRSYRRTYHVNEAYWGAGTGAVLLGLVGWVSWKGAHPDPTLFDMSAALQGDTAATGVDVIVRDSSSRDSSSRDSSSRDSSSRDSSRGPLPPGLASAAFKEGKLGAYSSENLYVKINGRAGFFQSFGVKSLHSVTLEATPGSEAGSASIDIELYDLGESQNAIGAYNGERPPAVDSQVSEDSTYHYDRNAAFLARGPYYVRVLGSDESAPVLAEVRRLLSLFRSELAGAARPWAFALFVDQLKLAPAQVTYVRKNAFSLGFANDVFTATLSAADSEQDTQAFVAASADASSALGMAEQYRQAFASSGAPAGQTPAGVALYKDEFLGSISSASSMERWVVGVIGAPDAAAAAQILERLKAGIQAMPAEERARAVPQAAPPENAAAAPSLGEAEGAGAVTDDAVPGRAAGAEGNTAGSGSTHMQGDNDEY